MPTAPPAADIAVSATLDGLIVIPRVARETVLLKSHLRRALPNIKIASTSLGIFINARDSGDLLRVAASVGLHNRPEVDRFVLNRVRVRSSYSQLREQISAIKTNGVDFARTLLPDLLGRNQLDDHQLINVAAMTLDGAYGLSLFDEQGAGKTVSFIYAFDLLIQRDKADIAVIIAPKSMIAEWPQDFVRFKGDLYKIAVLAGPRLEKASVLAAGGDVYITNFETVVSMEQELRALLRRYEDRAILVVDESFFIKNPDAKRTQALRRLREWAGRAFVLCGTPAPNAPKDIIEQFNFVDFGITFENLKLSEDHEKQDTQIQALLDSRGLFVRHLKQDVLPDLPGKHFQRVLVPLQPLQQRIYNSILSNLLDELRHTDDVTFKKNLASFLAKRASLLQVCSHPGSVVTGYGELPAKLAALDGLLDQLIQKDREKVIVWSFFTHSIQQIMNRYTRFNPVRYDGTITDVKNRRAAVQAFQESTEVMLFVGNPSAAGAGLTLHRAKYAVYESMSNQAAHYLQSIDRIHRRGQTREVEYIILLGKNTVEVSEFDRISDKEGRAQRLLGDNIAAPLTREAMLREVEAAAELIGAK